MVLACVCWMGIDKDALGSYYCLMSGKFMTLLSIALYLISAWISISKLPDPHSFIVIISIAVIVEVAWLIALIFTHAKYPNVSLLMSIKETVGKIIAEIRFDRIIVEWDPELITTEICFYEEGKIVHACVIPDTKLHHAKIIKDYCDYLWACTK